MFTSKTLHLHFSFSFLTDGKLSSWSLSSPLQDLNLIHSAADRCSKLSSVKLTAEDELTEALLKSVRRGNGGRETLPHLTSTAVNPNIRPELQ